MKVVSEVRERKFEEACHLIRLHVTLFNIFCNLLIFKVGLAPPFFFQLFLIFLVIISYTRKYMDRDLRSTRVISLISKSIVRQFDRYAHTYSYNSSFFYQCISKLSGDRPHLRG